MIIVFDHLTTMLRQQLLCVLLEGFRNNGALFKQLVLLTLFELLDNFARCLPKTTLMNILPFLRVFTTGQFSFTDWFQFPEFTYLDTAGLDKPEHVSRPFDIFETLVFLEIAII